MLADIRRGRAPRARQRRFARPTSLASCLVVTIVSIVSPARAERTDINPAAPPETAQYLFMLGDWSCATSFMGADGAFTDGSATWSAELILDGWAVQDTWISERPDGSRFHGTNIRSFNPKLGTWECRWLPQGTLEWSHFTSEMVDDTMVMTGSGTDARGAYVDHNIFHDITDESWSWRKERSWDGGATWTTVGHIHARRITSTPGG